MGKNALIIGAGHGLSASVARLFAAEGMKVGLVARNTNKLAALANEIGAHTYSCDATDPDMVSDLFNAFDANIGSPDILVYNPNVMLRGPITEVDPVETKNSIMVSAFGAFLAAQQATIRIVEGGFRNNAVHGCVGWHKGLSKFSSLRDG